jgi:hypothetical protein
MVLAQCVSCVIGHITIAGMTKQADRRHQIPEPTTPPRDPAAIVRCQERTAPCAPTASTRS